jgi:hypothetical protein
MAPGDRPADLPARVAPNPSVTSQRLDDATVVLDVDPATSYGLDDVGTAIWSALREAPDVPAAIDRLLDSYEVDRPTLENDVARFIGQLAGLGLLAPEPAAS